MPKEMEFDVEARKRLRDGVDELAGALAVTLGPRGRTVVLDRGFGSPTVTKDGVTVAREIELEAGPENMAVQMVKQVAQNTADEAGDGTTTATVLAHSIFTEGLKSVTAGVDPMGLRRGINAGVRRVVERLQELSTDTASREEVTQVATVSANGDAEIGELIARAMEEVGRDGVLSVEEGRSLEMELETVEGMRFDEGYLSPYFVTDQESMEALLENPLILVHDESINRMNDLLPVLEQVKEAGRPLLIIADEVEDEALATLTVNQVRGTLRVCAIEGPGFGDRAEQNLRDIAALTGAELISETLGRRLEDTALDDLGTARRVVVDADSTTIVDGGGSEDEIWGRIEEIRTSIERSTSDYETEKLQERLARLSGGVAVLRVGGATETAMQEKKDRTEDAVAATQAAVEEGILPGGGVALIRALEALEELNPDEQAAAIGVELLARALTQPARRIAENAGAEGSIVVERIRESDDVAWGYNADTDTYENLIETGIIDPTKVVRTAVQNAASVAGVLLTTESLIANLPEEEPEGGGPGGPGGGGMPGGGGGMPGGGMPGGMGGMGGMM